MHTLCHPESALAGGHDGEAEARRCCLCQRHGHPDTDAPRLVALAISTDFGNFLNKFSNILLHSVEVLLT